MSEKLICLDKEYSTTRLCYRLLDGNFLGENSRIKEELKFRVNIPKFNIQNSKIRGKPEDKFETYLFLPPREGRKGEGGLRTKGYFKFSYKKTTSGKGKGVNSKTKEWWIVDENDNFIEEANLPETILQQLSTNNHKLTQLPLITVITVVLNGAKYLEETIQSVINQTYPNVEYIIIDGGSTDGTLDIIKKYEDKIDYWISEKDRGISEAFNRGIRLSHGQIIGLINSDDFLEQDALEKVFSILLLNKKCDIFYGKIQYWKEKTKNYIFGADHKYLSKFMSINHPATFVKLDVYKRLGLFDLAFNKAMDYEFCLRCYMKNCKFCYIDELLANMRLEGVSDNYWREAYYESYIIKNKYLNKKVKNFIYFLWILIKTGTRKKIEKYNLHQVVLLYRSIFSKKIKKYNNG